MLTPFPGTLDFDKWERATGHAAGLRRHAAHPALADSASKRPKYYMPHPT
jgi:hypothetical protein